VPLVAPPIASFAPPLLMRLTDPPEPPMPPSAPLPPTNADSAAGGRTAKDCGAKAAARKGGCPARTARKALAVANATVAASGESRHRGLFASNTGSLGVRAAGFATRAECWIDLFVKKVRAAH